ncbi:helix-turn-helix domain-containing protein [Kallotenue papyrolyticum]|uniref:helix-turn-helix domain-containing protein n=1 Tax=Kallotenue papyrolyticum TaxID=1325125 RepID=UPI0009DDDEEF|nr:AraC family transcriptional regulator [Kallotenue papyrolyticum]
MHMTTDLERARDDCQPIHVVKQYIHEHLDEALTRDVLATVAGFSVPHLHRIFKAHTGESIAAYVRRLRLERAGRKLRMGAVDITEVALAAGYQTHAAFGKAFKQQFGLSPSAFRQLSCQAATHMLMKGTAT